MKLLPWSCRSATPRAVPAERWPNCWRTAMPIAWVASKRLPLLLTCQPMSSAFQCSATPNSQTLPSCTVITCVASIAHMTFGASVTMWRSCAASGRGRVRWGDSSACSRIRRSTRLREVRIPSIARSLAQTLRWPSPVQGERARSARMAASSAASETAGSAHAGPDGMAAPRTACPPGGRRRSWSAARTRSGRHDRCRSDGHWRGRSTPPSPRPPAGQRAGSLDLRAQQLDLHAELADALHGGSQLTAGRVGVALLQRAVQRRLRRLAPLLQLEDRQTELAREQFGGLAAHQAQHDLALAPDAPALARRQRADPSGD